MLEIKNRLRANSELLKLVIDPRNGQINQKSVDEVESIMQAQQENELFGGAIRSNSLKR